jgi:tRNA(Ile)-lysidine synthase
MARSHPPALLKLVERTLREECAISAGDRLLLAVSGGPDSIAMLHAVARLAPRLRIELRAHGVDHGLRAEAPAELELAAELAEHCRVGFTRTHVAVAPGGDLQARARRARHDALAQAAAREGCTSIATAHHADDRAETLLIRLLRGSGPRGLAVLPARSGKLIRPLLRARRADVLAHIARHRLRFAEDPSNRDRRFVRVRVREEVLPLLESISPQIVKHLNALADQLEAGPAPVLVDESGVGLTLGRAHVQQIRRAQALGLTEARVLLPGGKSLRIDGSGVPILELGRADRVRNG